MNRQQEKCAWYLPWILGGLICSLNSFDNVAICSLLVVLIIFTANIIAEKTGYLYTKTSVLVSCVFFVIFDLLVSRDYYINGQVVNYLQHFSYLSLCISVGAGLCFLERFKESNFLERHLVSMMVAITVDSLIMYIFLSKWFSMEKGLDMFGRDLLWKLVYVVIGVSGLIIGKMVQIELIKRKYGKKAINNNVL